MFIITCLTNRPSVWAFPLHAFLNDPRKSCFQKKPGRGTSSRDSKNTLYYVILELQIQAQSHTHTHTHTHTSWGAATQKNKPEKSFPLKGVGAKL